MTFVDQNHDNADAMKSQVKFQISLQGIEKPKKEIKVIFPPKFLQSFVVDGFDTCKHISFVEPNNVWVSDISNNLILTNTKCKNIHHVNHIGRGHGIHTVNSDNELIYIDNANNIKKLSSDTKTTTTFVEATHPQWRKTCVFWSKTTEDLLVGMDILGKKKAKSIQQGKQEHDDFLCSKVIRYNKTGKEIQTIQFNKRQQLFKQPLYITENNNGDVVVSDNKNAVVVTDCRGKHRFNYIGHPPGSGLSPRGICTDSLSHILVVDTNTKTVHMINQDGKFLSYLLTNSQSQDKHHISCLSYDVKNSRLWVGSWKKNKVSVYRYIDKTDALTGKSD